MLGSTDLSWGSAKLGPEAPSLGCTFSEPASLHTGLLGEGDSYPSLLQADQASCRVPSQPPRAYDMGEVSVKVWGLWVQRSHTTGVALAHWCGRGSRGCCLSLTRLWREGMNRWAQACVSSFSAPKPLLCGSHITQSLIPQSHSFRAASVHPRKPQTPQRSLFTPHPRPLTIVNPSWLPGWPRSGHFT